jgi:purine-binding chemotaxis protein CheW
MSEKASIERRICTFYLADECYGIDILAVREINRQVSMTPARGAPSAVRGLMNLRGQIVTVIDPAIRLGYPPRQVTPRSRLIILKTNAELRRVAGGSVTTSDEPAGLWVDRISDVVEIESEKIGPPPPDHRGKSDRLITGVVQLKSDVIRIVDPQELLRLDEGE